MFTSETMSSGKVTARTRKKVSKYQFSFKPDDLRFFFKEKGQIRKKGGKGCHKRIYVLSVILTKKSIGQVYKQLPVSLGRIRSGHWLSHIRTDVFKSG